MWSVKIVLISYVAIFSTTSGTPRKLDRESCPASSTRTCSHRSEAALADLKRSMNTIKFDCGEVCDTSSKIEKRRSWKQRPGKYVKSLKKKIQCPVITRSTAFEGFNFVRQALFLSAPFLSKMEIVHLFSSSLPRFDKCHEMSRIFPRTEQTFASARSFGVIS